MLTCFTVKDIVNCKDWWAGFCEGSILGFGARVEGFTNEVNWVQHLWTYFENGKVPMNGSCGSSILDKNRKLVSFFRFPEDEGHAVSVLATILREFNYELCEGVQTF